MGVSRMKELEKVDKTLEEIEDVKIYINQAYMKIDLLEKQIENLKMVTSSWIMSLMDVRESEVNNRRGEVLREIERRMEKLAK